MRIHKLKTWPVYFRAIVKGTKTFELRNNDRDFQVGDLLILQEYVPTRKAYTVRSVRKKVTYVMKNGSGRKFREGDILRSGYVALGLGEP